MKKVNEMLKSIYPYNEYTLTELLCRMYEDILDITGLTKEEISRVVKEMFDNGEIDYNVEISAEQLQAIIDKMIEDGSIVIPDPEVPIVTTGASAEYLSLTSYATEQGIDTSSDWYSALSQAIQYCINNKRSLFIPNGTYNISQPIEIISTEELGLVIQGESQEHCHLKFVEDGFKFDNGLTSIDYQKRVRFVTIKDLTIERQDRTTKLGNGLCFQRHGYITLENIRIRDFNKGLSLINGSEDTITNCAFLGNNIGVYLNHPYELSTGHDLGLIKFDHCMIHNNYQNTMIIDSVREVTFINCAIMDYHGSCQINGITNIMTFLGCVFENSNYNSESVCDSSLVGTPIPDLEINSLGTINVISCQFANNYEKKIWLKSDVKLNLRDNLFQAVPRPVYIDASANPKIQNSDEAFVGYWCSGANYDNYTKPNLINVANFNFSTGSVIPFSQAVVGSASNTVYATGGASMYFERGTTQYAFNLNLKNLPMYVMPEVAEIIITNNCGTLNLLWVQFADGTYKHCFDCGGAEQKICEFEANGQTWIKIRNKLPQSTPDNPITLIGIVVPQGSGTVYLDSFNLYGVGFIDRYYSDGAPVRGFFNKGDIIWCKKTESVIPQTSSVFYGGWCITADNSSGTTAPTYKKFGFSLT